MDYTYVDDVEIGSMRFHADLPSVYGSCTRDEFGKHDITALWE